MSRPFYDHQKGEWGFTAEPSPFTPAAASVPHGTNNSALKRLQRIVEQVESAGGYLAAIFGTASPEYKVNQSLWIILRHDLDIMEQQASL